MSIGLVDFLLSASVAILGVLTGWFLCKAPTYRKKPGEQNSASQIQFEHAESILARLHDLAAGVAADVGQHNTQVKAISGQLAAGGGSDTEVVVKAVGQLLAANTRMQQQLDCAQEQLRQQAEEIQSQTAAARTDALTGLANRRVFDDEIRLLTKQFQDQGTPFSVTILDVDHFKVFNDTHGHQVGDRVLQHAATVYQNTIPETDIVTRFGGEEFAVIHPWTTVEDAARRADALRRALDTSTVRIEGKELHITASLGVAQAATDETPADLIQRADSALYAAKEAGRNRTFWHNGTEVRPFQAKQPIAAPPPAVPLPEAPPAAAAAALKRAAMLQRSLLDRPRLLARLAELLADSSGGQTAPPTAMLVQVDRFEDHLNRYGSDTGEKILDAVATVLLAVARNSGVVARFSSHTFAILLSGYNTAQAVQVAEQIRNLSHQCPLPTQVGLIQFTLSIGAARAIANDDAVRVIERAQAALDSAMRSGGDNTFSHNGQWTETARAILHEANCAT